MMSQNEAESIAAEIRSHPGLVVLRGFDDCTPEQFWLLDMTGPEFERWWAERDEFWWPVTKERQAEYEEFARILGEEPNPPPLRDSMVLPGKFLPSRIDRDKDDELLSSLWWYFCEVKRFHFCHLCCDLDSFLVAPDGRRIYHKGYTGQRYEKRETTFTNRLWPGAPPIL